MDVSSKIWGLAKLPSIEGRYARKRLERKRVMPLFIIERNFAEQLEVTRDSASQVNLINEGVGVNWIFSFLSADKKKTYCLYEAPSVEAIREAARRANLPADVIIEVNGQVLPDGSIRPIAV